MADRTTTVRLRAEVNQFNRSIGTSTTVVGGLESRLGSADKGINQLTGRLKLLADIAPAAVAGIMPLGGVAVAGVAGLASQLGFAAVAGGVLIGSMQGLGAALSALNKADLDPTAENLAKAEDALNRLSPAAAAFAREANALAPTLRAIRDMGADSLFPGLSKSLDDFERLAPVVGGIIESVGGALGDIASDGAASLASDRWAGFFDFIETEAPTAISELSRTVGSLTHGLAELWMAFTPLNNDVSAWMTDAADAFDRWATGLDQTQGFQEFVEYIRTTGPQVADTLAAVADMFIQITQAVAPLGGPTLAILEAVSKSVAAIADSNLGTPLLAAAGAMGLLSRATAAYSAVSGTGFGKTHRSNIIGMATALDATRVSNNRATMSVAAFAAAEDKRTAATRAGLTTIGKGAAVIGALTLATSGAADGMGLTNTATMALMGTMAGPWGAAVGGGIGLLMDMRAANDRAAEATATYEASLKTMTVAQLEATLAAEERRAAEETPVASSPQGGTAALRADSGDREKIALIKDQITATRELDAAKAREAITDRAAAVAFAARAGMNVDVGNSAEVSAKKIVEMAKAMRESREAAREAGRATASSFGLMGDSIDDAKVSLNAWLAEQAKASRALARFNDNSLKAAREGLDKGLIKSLREMGAEGALRMDQLANGTKSGINQANASWRSMQAEIRRTERITQNLLGLSPVKIKVDAETIAAMTAIDRVRTAMANLKDKTVTVRVTQTGAAVTPGFGPVGSADGSTVPKSGRPYADRHLYLLADGEEVISNRYGQADRHRPLLKAINGGLAEGGTAGETAKERLEKAKDRADAAKRRAEERRQREEEKRQRRLDAQRSKDLLASNLRDEAQQQALEVADAKRRLRSARKADRPAGEVRDAQLALKTERTESRELRDQRREDARQTQEDQRERERQQAQEDEEARREHEARVTEALIEGQERAASQLIDAAEVQKASAESVRDSWAQAMERVGSAATSGFRSNLFGDQQHGLWSGTGGGGSSWRDALLGDIGGLEARGGLIGLLTKQGVTGTALEALLGQASNDQISSLLDAGEADDFAALFTRREALQGTVSTQAGQAAFGQEWAMAAGQVSALGNQILVLQQQLAAITAQRPITVYETISAQATAAEVARIQSMAGAA